MDRFMKRAVELAANNVKDGGQPFGAVLVKDDEVIAEGVNELHIKYDVSGHAELIAIRKAQEKLQTIDLSGYTMYASGEPCPMCMTAIYFSGIKNVYYCASIEDAKENGLGASSFIYKELSLSREHRSIDIIHMPLEPGMVNPLSKWANK
ncbi:nucleoside deaminase [Bacillus sp. FJAT-49711]|uniref:nucleoside deaminase n=1 Tax=Bacillus sp. FJAT-49711 TaxID=2833585 RepID=UPI001BC97A97|nr:nucleoside deaminase [Bacillus sp. FJAT-49711]MBS4218732.1 nucleoside deaminase [Bacillus sp. FJAT-49711]